MSEPTITKENNTEAIVYKLIIPHDYIVSYEGNVDHALLFWLVKLVMKPGEDKESG